MEFLNNIWAAISVPNTELINIIFIFLLPCIEIPLIISLIKNIFNLSPTRKQTFLLLFIFSLVGIINLFFIHDPYNVIINYTTMFVSIFIIFKMNILKTLLATFLPSMIFSLVGALILNPFLNLFNITYEEINTVVIYRIPFVITMYTIALIINLIIKHKNFKLTILDNFDKKNKGMIISNFLFGLFNIIVQIIITVNYIDILPIEFTFLNFISLSAYFSISLYSLNKVTSLVTTTEKLVTTTEKLESAEAYNQTLHILHDSVRGFKHDFNNIVSTIGGFINNNDMDGLKNYYSQLEDDNQRVNNLYILNPDLINNPGIYNLIVVKYKKATKQDIKVNLTFLLDLNKLHMKIYEFARILGILLDNAIEAAGESEEKVINIVFRKDYKNKRNIIQIENSYADKDVNLDKIFDKGISGKEDHSGIGLWEVREILKRNNNINLFTTKSPTYFCQQLEIYYTEDDALDLVSSNNSDPESKEEKQTTPLLDELDKIEKEHEEIKEELKIDAEKKTEQKEESKKVILEEPSEIEEELVEDEKTEDSECCTNPKKEKIKESI